MVFSRSLWYYQIPRLGITVLSKGSCLWSFPRGQLPREGSYWWSFPNGQLAIASKLALASWEAAAANKHAVAFKFRGHYKSHSHRYSYTAESIITVTLIKIIFQMPWVLYMICACQIPAVWWMPTGVLGLLPRGHLNSDKPQQIFVYTTISATTLHAWYWLLWPHV